MPAERVTVTFPPELVRDIDRLESNRSRFIQEAVRHELERRRREELRVSLHQPHPEIHEMAELGLEEWAARVPDHAVENLVDAADGTEIRWLPEEGWREEDG